MAKATSSSLTDTLLLALNQSQKQIQTIQRQALQIEELQRENEVIRKELEKARNGDTLQDREASVTSTQVQDLFQKNIDAQTEIKRLHKRLRAYKDKVNERLQAPLSSPAVSSSIPHSPSLLAELPNSSQLGKRASSPSSPPRKRLKPCLTDPKATPPRPSTDSADSDKMSRDFCSVLVNEQNRVAEELAIGCSEDHTDTCSTSAKLRKDDDRISGIHDRLDALLATSRPIKLPFPRPRSSTPERSHSHSKEKILLQMSKVRQLPSVNEGEMIRSIQSQPPLKQSERLSVGRKEVHHLSPPAAEESATREKSAKPFEKHYGGEPLRRRPLQHLSLHHFKLNPQASANPNIVIGGTASDWHSERINTRMETDPNGLGNGELKVLMSDYEVLLEFLGAGSEAQIARLSLPARSELLSEARKAQAAKALAPGEIKYDFHGDAPGFWSADMPATQENINNKVVAKYKERKEVELRYHDAMTTRERWMFVDE